MHNTAVALRPETVRQDFSASDPAYREGFSLAANPITSELHFAVNYFQDGTIYVPDAAALATLQLGSHVIDYYVSDSSDSTAAPIGAMFIGRISAYPFTVVNP